MPAAAAVLPQLACLQEVCNGRRQLFASRLRSTERSLLTLAAHAACPFLRCLPCLPQLRYVMMAGKTDGPEDIEALIQFCSNKRSMQAIEVLPYHLLGVQVRQGARKGCAGVERKAAGQGHAGACGSSGSHGNLTRCPPYCCAICSLWSCLTHIAAHRRSGRPRACSTR